MSFCQSDAAQLHYQVCDVIAPWVRNAPTVIFTHGVAATLDLWTKWLPILASDFRLAFFDTRGFGKSAVPKADFPWSFDVLTRDIIAVADAIGARQFHLVGESIGGTAAISCALAHPARVLSLTISNAAPRGGAVTNVANWRDIIEREGQDAWAEQMMGWRFFPAALESPAYDWFLQVHASCSAAATLKLVDLLRAADFTPRLGELAMPVLLLSPDSSPFVPLDVMTEMKSRIPGAELQVFARSRHGLPLSHGEACARTLKSFLSRHFS